MFDDNICKHLELMGILIWGEKIINFCEKILFLFFELKEAFINKII
jgi:hypothetical protein